MAGVALGIKVDLTNLRKGFTDLERKQLPFARAQALTATAGQAGIAWQEEMKKDLDRPTPFTVNSVGVRGARKDNLVATVFLKDIAAQYLEPFVDGGLHFARGHNLLTPKNQRTNQYGNLPRRKLEELKSDPNVFIGTVKFKNGQAINGVWARGDRGKRRRGGYGTKGGTNVDKNHQKLGLSARTTLTLLIRFSDPQPVKQRLDLVGPTERAVRQHYPSNFARAWTKAMATARR